MFLYYLILILSTAVLQKYLISYIDKEFEFIPVRKNGKFINISAIKRILTIKLRIDLDETLDTNTSPYFSPIDKKIVMPLYDRGNLNWYATLAHEIGHGKLHNTSSWFIAYFSSTMSIKIAAFLIIIISDTSMVSKILWFSIIAACINTIRQEVQASWLGFKLLCTTLKLNKQEKVFIFKNYTAAIVSYLCMIISIVTIIFLMKDVI